MQLVFVAGQGAFSESAPYPLQPPTLKLLKSPNPLFFKGFKKHLRNFRKCFNLILFYYYKSLINVIF